MELSIELPPDLPEVLVDVTQIPIALKNLIRNARDAMPNGGTITISAQTCNDFVELVWPTPVKGSRKTCYRRSWSHCFRPNPVAWDLD